jgi:malate dehydrogenase
MIASGYMLGNNVKVELNLLDIQPCEKTLGGVKMELEDCAYPLLTAVNVGSDPNEMLRDVDIAIFVGGFPRKAGMERKELLERNVNIFREQGAALNVVGKQTTKCLVVANPANTNCYVLSHFAPNIPKKNFSALTRLDHNRALAQIANRVGTEVHNVRNVVIWGNHSSTQYPDVNHGTANGQPIRSVVSNDEWLNSEFITTVQRRGAAIIEARNSSSAMSAANAAVNHIKSWVSGTPEGEYVSMAVLSDGSYGIDEGICYSFPVTCQDGEWTVVQGLNIDDFSREKMELTKAELIEERNEALSG